MWKIKTLDDKFKIMREIDAIRKYLIDNISITNCLDNNQLYYEISSMIGYIQNDLDIEIPKYRYKCNRMLKKLYNEIIEYKLSN